MSREPSSRQVILDGRVLVTVLGDDDGEAPAAPVDGELVISRFAWIRNDGGQLVVETSLGPRAAVLEDPRALALLFAFTTPHTLDAALAAKAELPLEVATEIAHVLRDAALLVNADQAGAEGGEPLAVWEFHDLLFHARSRPGRSRLRHGGTYRFLDRTAPMAALPPERWPGGVALERPDFEELERDDPPLSSVQERRRSIRRYGEQPIRAGQLSEFLYRVGRVDDYWEIPVPGPGSGTSSFVSKPYPSGGAAYELELYAAVQECDGIDPGLYHYVASDHRLARASGPGDELDQIFVNAAGALGTAANSLQVLIVITARFDRVAWKYESIAYELVLKHVGVVMAMMYLSATAMDLAPCAIGTGNSDLFARVSGVDYYEEPAVGEFALGSRRPGSA
jgi:SagB-type dehydrogenase family enzyme